jgi:dihydroneopterin aldolase/2-amino-4-hydroxy-6-hydroxymethyldihydropteridine diphosphokinase
MRSPADRILLTGIRVHGFHGVHPEERRLGQDFVVDLELELSLAAAAASDDVADTVHYGVLAREVAAAVAADPVDLIETVAERIAELSLRRPLVERVRVTVHKPDAPIPLDFQDVAVVVERERLADPVVIALGANLGDRAATLTRAIEVLDLMPDITVTGRSPRIETVPMTPDGPDPARPGYLNQVITLRTALPAVELLAMLHAVEHAFGRQRGEVWADRTLDLDLITYGAALIRTAALTVPHPRAHERDFVLRPWLALDPDAVLPGHGPVRELLSRIESGTAGSLGGNPDS